MDVQATAQMLGNFGEFVGAIAVVLTLVYLTYQVRQNTVAIRQQSYNNIVQRRTEWFRTGILDRAVFQLVAKGVEGQKFDVVDAGRFTNLMLGYFSHLQDCYLQYRAGIVEQSVWDAELRIMSGSLRRPGLQRWWGVARQFFVSEFIAALDEQAKAVELVQYDPETSEWFLGGEYPGARQILEE